MRKHPLLLVLVGWACGGDDTAVPAGDAGVDADHDASSSSDSSINPPVDAGPAIGQVDFEAQRQGPSAAFPTGAFRQGVTFTRIDTGDAGPPAQTCTTTTSGECLLAACTPTGDASTVTPPAGDAGAGAITVTGFAIDGGVRLTPGTDGTYATVTADVPGWSGSENIGYSWAGATDERDGPLAPFSLDVPAPAPIIVTAPLLPDSGSLELPRSADLSVTWTTVAPPAQPTSTRVLLSITQTEPRRRLSCTFPVERKSGIVPKELLGMFAAENGHLQLTSDVTKGTRHGQWNVSVKLEAVAANMSPYPFGVVFE